MTVAGLLPVILIGGTPGSGRWARPAPATSPPPGTIAIRIAQMTGWVSFVLMTIYANLGEVEDGMRTLTHAHAGRCARRGGSGPRSRGAVRFENVSFAYGRRSGGVERIDLDIRPGEKIGIVGASGAGKSTLVALLLRLYDVEGGRVLVDGHDVRG
jgi:ATP-binding cassette, subfamily B, bacterial